jgi:hypothetical protein
MDPSWLGIAYKFASLPKEYCLASCQNLQAFFLPGTVFGIAWQYI